MNIACRSGTSGLHALVRRRARDRTHIGLGVQGVSVIIVGGLCSQIDERGRGPTHFSFACTCRRRVVFCASLHSVRRRRHCNLPQETTCRTGGNVGKMADSQEESRASREPSMRMGVQEWG